MVARSGTTANLLQSFEPKIPACLEQAIAQSEKHSLYCCRNSQRSIHTQPDAQRHPRAASHL